MILFSGWNCTDLGSVSTITTLLRGRFKWVRSYTIVDEKNSAGVLLMSNMQEILVSNLERCLISTLIFHNSRFREVLYLKISVVVVDETDLDVMCVGVVSITSVEMVHGVLVGVHGSYQWLSRLEKITNTRIRLRE